MNQTFTRERLAKWPKIFKQQKSTENDWKQFRQLMLWDALGILRLLSPLSCAILIRRNEMRGKIWIFVRDEHVWMKITRLHSLHCSQKISFALVLHLKTNLLFFVTQRREKIEFTEIKATTQLSNYHLTYVLNRRLNWWSLADSKLVDCSLIALWSTTKSLKQSHDSPRLWWCLGWRLLQSCLTGSEFLMVM